MAQKLPEGGRFGLLDDPNSEWERAFIHLPAEGRRPGLLLLGSPRSSDGTGLTGSDRLLRIVALDDSSMRVLGRKFPEDEAEGMGSRRRFPRERAALASYDPAETERWFFSREACESGLSEVWDTIEQDGRMTTRAGFVVDEGAAYFRSVPGDDDGPPPIITGKTWYFWPNSVGELPTRHESPGPNYRSYFNKVYRQIIDTPEASEKLLKRVQAGWQPPHYSPGGPVPSAWPLSGNGGYGAPGFLRYVSEPFLPKKPPTYIAIPQEEGWLDIVRGRTRGGEYTVDVAFTKNVVAVRVSGIERESRKPNRIFREFRKLFFPYYMEDIRRTVILLRPQQINDADGSQREDLAYGCHDLREVRHSDFDHWADKFCWWLGPDEIGFISSRGEGLSTQNFPNISEKYNAHWFSPQAPTQSKVPSEDIQLHLK